MHADLEVQIMDQEREIARLPQGSIAKKTIRGKEYYYHRIHTDGKRKETYISFEEYPALKMQIERRQELEKELRNLKKSLPDSKARQEKKQQSQYKTIVRIGAPLANQIAIVKNYRKRECYGILRDYVLGDPIDKVFILYGLRRTGKTTMIRQMLADLPKSEFSRAAFIQVTSKDTLSEITNVINHVVENINHSFARSVIDRTFHSHDLSVTASNLLRDRDMPINFKEHIDLDTVIKGIKDVLDILNKEEQHIQVEESHMIQIKEYLTLLDLIMEIDLEFLPDVSKRNTITVLTQPGLRYAQATAIIDNVLLDEKFQELTLRERKRIVDRLMSEISGRMMEEIVLLETKLAHPDKHVFKLQFSTGEFDMVISDSETLSCEIFEVKYSREAVKEQYVHLKDKEKCSMTERRYGEIAGRYVIYRGSSTSIDGIKYVNVEEYLKSL